jgi:hypothetical protein
VDGSKQPSEAQLAQAYVIKSASKGILVYMAVIGAVIAYTVYAPQPVIGGNSLPFIAIGIALAMGIGIDIGYTSQCPYAFNSTALNTISIVGLCAVVATCMIYSAVNSPVIAKGIELLSILVSGEIIMANLVVSLFLIRHTRTGTAGR